MYLSKLFAILLFSLVFLHLNAQETNKEAESYYMDLMKYVETLYGHFEQYSANLTAEDYDGARKHLGKLSTLGSEYLNQLNNIEPYQEDSTLKKAVEAYLELFVDGSKKDLLRVLNYNQNTYFTDEEAELANEASLRFTENSTKIISQFNEVATHFYQTHVQISNEVVFCAGLQKMLGRLDNSFEGIKGEEIPNTMFGNVFQATELLPFMAEGRVNLSFSPSAIFVFYRDSDPTAAVQYFDMLEGFVEACDLGWVNTKKPLAPAEWESLKGRQSNYLEEELLFGAKNISISGTKTEDLYEVSIRISEM